MTDTWLRKQRTLHAGPIAVTVAIPVEMADKLRASTPYRRIVEPVRSRRSKPRAVPGPTAALDAKGRALLPRVGEIDWYHTIDLGHGVVTPGRVDHRAQLPYYRLPASLAGKRVLDVGTFDGFWAFEFERRGAEVVALDVATWADWDLPQRTLPHAADLGLGHEMGRGFALAHEVLGSKVQRVEGTIYDLDPAVHGEFDLVFISDLLVHLRCPQRALECAASVCRGEMVVADVFDPRLEGLADLPFAQYTAPGETWWLPNVKTLNAMMSVAGCEDIDEVSRFVLDERGDDEIHKVVLRGRTSKDPLWLRAYREWALTQLPKWKSAAEQPA